MTLWTKHKNIISSIENDYESDWRALEEQSAFQFNANKKFETPSPYNQNRRESFATTGTNGSTTIITKSMDHWDKKVKEVQRIFSDLLSNKVLESISSFTSKKDMIGAWNMLNKRYFERLIPYADTIFAALRTYSIRPKQGGS